MTDMERLMHSKETGSQIYTGNAIRFVPTIQATLGSILYIFSVILLLRDYASVEWSIYGYHFDGINLLDSTILVIACTICSVFVPKRITNPSSLFMIVSYLLVVLPSLACLVGMKSNSSVSHFLVLFSICLSFSISCVISQMGRENEIYKPRAPAAALAPSLLALALILIVFLYIRFGSIIEFVSLDTLYVQRERGAADNFIDGYAQTYSQYVISTSLAAFGIYKRNIFYFIIGIIGSILNFGITAEKAGLIYPVFVIVLAFSLISKRKFLLDTYFIMSMFSLILMFSLCTRFIVPGSDFICWYLGTRTILTPGAFVVYYADFFSQSGYTYLSHVRGLNLLIPMPGQYLGDPRWPALGVMVGEDYLGIPRLNANASFLATDGIASFGIWGCFVAFGILAAISRAFDYLGRGIPSGLLLPILFPIALTLSNGSSLTVLTSFGGLFWMLVFAFAFREAPKSTPIRTQGGRSDRQVFAQIL